MNLVEINPTQETAVPAIPEPTPGNLLEVVRAIREVLEVREGINGDPLDQVLTVRDLYAMGKLDYSALDSKVYVRLPGSDGMVFITPSSNTTPEYNAPPAPTGFTVSSGLATFILEWAEATYHGHAYTEVWRAGVNDIGLAVMIGTEDSSIYSDKIGSTGVTRYFWIRHVSKAGVPGPFNATAGTSATTGLVLTGDVFDGAITTAKIADGAVTTLKLGDASVTSTKIGDSQVIEAKIGAAAVTTTKLGDLAVTTAKINDLAITSGKLADGSITLTKHASGLRPVEIVNALPAAGTEGRTVYLTTDDKLYRDTGTAWTAAVATTDLSGTISTAQIADAAVTTAKVAAANITEALLAASAVTETKIASDAVTSPKIIAGAITTVKIAAGAVTANEIAALTILAGNIAAGAITTAKLDALAVTADKIAANAVTTAKLDALAVTADKLAANSVIAGKVAAAAISTTELAAAAVTAGKLNIQTHGVTGLALTNNSPVAGSVTWSAFTLSWNGNTYSIGGGNSSSEMIWFDRSLSTTALQATTRTTFETDYNNADGDILLAINSGGTAETVYNATLLTAGGIKTGAVVADKIAANAVVAGKIAASAIVAGDGVIANAAIATAQIQDAAITNAKIGNLAVDTAKIADLAVSTAKIADANITNAKITDATITAVKIADATITNAKIVDATIQGAKIAAATITSSNIVTGTLTADTLAIGLADNLVDNPGFELGSTGWNTGGSWSFLTGADANTGNGYIQYTGTVTSTRENTYKAKCVPGDQFYLEGMVKSNGAGTTGAAGIEIQWLDKAGAALSVSSSGTVTSESAYTKLSVTAAAPANAVTARARLNVSTAPTDGRQFFFDDILLKRLVVGAFIQDLAVVTAKIADLTVTAAKINDATITNAKLVDATITGAKIAASTITASNLSVSQLSAISADMGAITAGTIALASSGHVRAGQTDYDNGTGFFLGFHSGTPKMSLGNSSGSKVTWDGTTLSVTGSLIENRAYGSGTSLVIGSWPQTDTFSATYVLMKEIYVPRAGTLTMEFDMHSSGGQVAFGRIYKNGVAAGTERSTSNTAWTSFSENIAVSAGDLVQLYAKTSNTSIQAWVRNFKLKTNFTSNVPVVTRDTEG